MYVVISREELALLLPAAGRYRVRIEEARGIPEECPQEIELLLRGVGPRPCPAVIRDRFRIRGHAWESLTGMARLLQLFGFAGVGVIPDTPMALGSLVGLELLVDIKRDAGSAGYPYVCVVGYHRPASGSLCNLFKSCNAIGSSGVERGRRGRERDGGRAAGV
jgi:hypothetical protein